MCIKMVLTSCGNNSIEMRDEVVIEIKFYIRFKISSILWCTAV